MEFVATSVVTVCWIVFGVVWLVAAFFTKRTAARHGTWSRWLILVVAAAGVLALFGPRRTAPPTRLLWSFTPAVGLVADAITLAGLSIALWARFTLGVYWSSNVVVKEDHAIVDRGPYRVVRHPIYSGVLLMLLGTVVLWGRLAGFFLLVLALAGLTMKARSEERLLTEYLGDSYRDYKARVRWALLPPAF